MSVKQLCNNYQENLNLMQRALRVSASFDIVSRKIQIGSKSACLFFMDGFAKDEILEKIMEFVMKLKPEDLPPQLIAFEQTALSANQRMSVSCAAAAMASWKH